LKVVFNAFIAIVHSELKCVYKKRSRLPVMQSTTISLATKGAQV
jgi:hypothetical protein